ncbi:hypothetical protein AJ88_15215 [Mesorhizobium amorphae CCBAU 01583]|nr:hypothetical protein AJ88_15215 [Mesorhizobium amorphae CCBAU 01583]
MQDSVVIGRRYQGLNDAIRRRCRYAMTHDELPNANGGVDRVPTLLIDSQGDKQVAIEIRTANGLDATSVPNSPLALGQVGSEVLRQKVPLGQALGMLMCLDHAPTRSLAVAAVSCRFQERIIV